MKFSSTDTQERLGYHYCQCRSHSFTKHHHY